MAGKQLDAMVTGYVSLNGSKAYFAGMDLQPANFDTLNEKEQEAALLKCKAEGDKRRKEHDAKQAKLAKEGKVQVISVTVNGKLVSGEVVWNKERSGLMARIALPILTSVTIEAKKAKKVNASTFLGL